MNPENYALFSIDRNSQTKTITQVDMSRLYNHDISYRKAHNKPQPQIKGPYFTDPSFTIQLGRAQTNIFGQGVTLRRIYQIYDKQFGLFDTDWFTQAYIDSDPDKQPSWIAQLSMIDKDYIKTRFMTKWMNKQGLYKYFVRRNGQYYVDYIDDMIPVIAPHQLPCWGLSIKQPWKLVLMKAWIKEKGGIMNTLKAAPFQFIDTFGLPGYRAMSMVKELEYLRVSKMSDNAKEAKQRRIPLNIPGFTIVAKTRDNPGLKEMGLVPNRAAYRIIPIQTGSQLNVTTLRTTKSNGQDGLFKIHSSLPTFWVGQYSVVSKGKLPTVYNKNTHNIHMQKQFLATYPQISQAFNKFYISPDYSSNLNYGHILETSIHKDIKGTNPHYFFEFQILTKGNINLNIQVPIDSGVVKKNQNGSQCTRYCPIKYFMARKTPQGKGDHQKYLYVDGEYVKGYHKSLNRFLSNYQPGQYIIYLKFQNSIQNKAQKFSININTTAKINKFQQRQVSPQQSQDIFRCSFYQFTQKWGIRVYLHHESKQYIVTICNKFEEIGFSAINLDVHPNSRGELCAAVYKDVLAQHDITLVTQAHGDVAKKGDTMVKFEARPGVPQTMVFEKLKRTNHELKKFPPEKTMDFYEIAPSRR